MRYWRIAPTIPAPRDHFDRVWSFDLANNTVAISWWPLGDIRGMSRAAIEDHAAQVYSDAKPNGIKQATTALLRFHGLTADGIEIGDAIIANRGRSTVVGVGTVIGESYYDEAKGARRIGPRTELVGCRFLPVQWEPRWEFRLPPGVLMHRTTMNELTRSRFELISSSAK